MPKEVEAKQVTEVFVTFTIEFGALGNSAVDFLNDFECSIVTVTTELQRDICSFNNLLSMTTWVSRRRKG